MLCKKHSEQGRSYLIADRSPHCVRDDNPFSHLPAVLTCGSCYFDELYSFSLAFFSMEGTQLGVAKAARSPPSFPFLG